MNMSTITSSKRSVISERPLNALPAVATAPVLWVAAGFVALELAVSARYGFHRDELYFLACARHMAWGYVDQPPFVPAVAWFSTHLFGTSTVAIRLMSAIAAGVTVTLTALMARELGGGHKAQTLAALAAATSSQVMAIFHVLSTAAFDTMFWAAITFVLLRLLRTDDERLWLAVGALAGVGLLNKFNVAFLLTAVAVALLISGRARMFRSGWLWAGAVLALVIWAPNVLWNAQHDWAAVSMMHSLHSENSNLGAVIGFVPSQFVVVGPLLIVFWVAGLRRLLATSFARALGIAYLILLVVYALSGAKSYYLAGMYFVLFAGGGVWAEERLDRERPPRGIRRWVALMLVGALFALPLVLPVLPETALARGAWESNINKDLSATVGWKPFVAQVAAVSRTLPRNERANVVVYTGDYGAAGAIDLWGKQYGLPNAISGHNSYWWWGPKGAHDGATTIAIDLPHDYLATVFTTCALAGSVATPHNVWTEERGDQIWVCRGQRETWKSAWPAARHYG
jgi:4-amino-4-deoxy-L-arabinose transferase-like glycosyltransferase